MSAARIGSVPFLNGRPLVDGLENVVLMPPSQLGPALRAGELDAALLPVVEVFETPNLHVVEGVAIAARGPVLSVLLELRRPLREVRSLAVDAASRTSVALARLILEKREGREIDVRSDGSEADAQLRIGDRALEFRKAHMGAVVLDLAEAWVAWQGLPFVFAVWAIRGGYPDPRPLGALLRGAAARGCSRLEAHAATEEELRYLRDHICYELGPRERAGMERFRGMLADPHGGDPPPGGDSGLPDPGRLREGPA